MKPKEDAAIQTEGAYLNRLGRNLLRYFPMRHQEHFSLGRERGSTDADMIAALGTPETVTKEILKQMPEGCSYFIRHTLRWGLLLVLSC